MDIPAEQALWFLILTLPSCLWAAWSDMRAMKIPNRATDLMLAIYLIAGAALVLWGSDPAWGWTDYLWRLVHFAVVLALGMALTAARLMGAGDAKFLAAAAPFVAVGDLGVVVMLYLATLLVTFVLHRIARASPLRTLAPGWESWKPGKRFPMGLAFGVTLPLYFLLAVLGLPRV
ncbi:MAG: prepilin peptidase [Rubellimicrobium sp.]|nr:prepilin peptidase [Rubellimicrobium sp.]